MAGHEQPSERWKRRAATREMARLDVLTRNGGTQEAEAEARASSLFLRVAREHSLSRGVQGSFLKAIHRLHEMKALVIGGTEEPGALALPLDIRTVERRAEGTVVLDKDVEYSTTAISQAELRQAQNKVHVWKTDVMQVIQGILLDPLLPPGNVFMQRRGDKCNVYVDADSGDILRSFEAWGGNRWTHCIESIQDGTYLLALVVWSDGVVVGSNNYHPWRIDVANLPYEFRKGERALPQFAYSEKPKIRKPRGSAYSEKLDPGQKDCKYTLESRTCAEVLGDLEYAAKDPVELLVVDADGTVRPYMFQVRIHHFQQDIEEWTSINGWSGKNCLDCHGVEDAMASGDGGGPGSENRPFLRLEDEFRCCTARLRTPGAYLATQASLMTLSRMEGKTRADAEAKKCRVKYRVPNALMRHRNLLPHGEARSSFAVNGFDILHGFRTGLLVKLRIVLEEISFKFFAQNAVVRTTEDIKALVDSRIAMMGNWYGFLNFKAGFYGSGDSGGLKGSENTILCRLLPFAFAGCPILIGAAPVRKKVLSHYWDAIRLLAELETEQYCSDMDIDVGLDGRVRRVFKGLIHMTDLLVDAHGNSQVPGHGFDILKVHLLGGVAKFVKRFGSVRTTDTETGERSQKQLTESDRLVGNDTLSLMKRLAALQEDHAVTGANTSAPPDAPQPSTCAQTRPSFGSSRAVCAEGNASWRSTAFDLTSGRYGPPVDDDVVTKCPGYASIALRLAVGVPACYEGKVAAGSSDGSVQYTVLRPGHTVILTDGLYAQILLPLLRFPSASAPGDARVQNKALAIIFERVSDRNKGFYPELAVPWLRRKGTYSLPVSLIARRVHIIPLFGDEHRPPRDTSSHYLVNTSAEPFFANANARVPRLRCWTTGCAGLIPKPASGGNVATCPNCTASRIWM